MLDLYNEARTKRNRVISVITLIIITFVVPITLTQVYKNQTTLTHASSVPQYALLNSSNMSPTTTVSTQTLATTSDQNTSSPLSPLLIAIPVVLIVVLLFLIFLYLSL